MKEFHIALLGAMPEEIGETTNNLIDLVKIKFGDLEIYSGQLQNQIQKDLKIIISTAWSGWGKVSAARAATRLISNPLQKKKVDIVIFTGLAGSANEKINQNDILIANEVVQHDMDASPLYPKYVIPAINKSVLKSNIQLNNDLKKVIESNLKKNNLNFFKNVHCAKIVSGDKFFSNKNEINKLKSQIGDFSAVEMEGASLAQVAIQENVPWLVIRVISDNADGSSPEEFSKFLKLYRDNSWALIEVIIKNLKIELL